MHMVFKGLALYVETISESSLHVLNSESSAGFLLSLATGARQGFGDVVECGRSNTPEISNAPEISPIILPDLASDLNTYRYETRDIRPHPAMIKVLFDKGLSPNESRGERTPWRELLMHMQEIQASGPSRLLKFIDTTKLFILYGADLTCTVPSSSNPTREETAVEVMTSIFEDLPRSVTQDLFSMISENLARQTMGKQHNTSLSASTNENSKRLEDRITAPSGDKKRKSKLPAANSTKRRRKR